MNDTIEALAERHNIHEDTMHDELDRVTCELTFELQATHTALMSVLDNDWIYEQAETLAIAAMDEQLEYRGNPTTTVPFIGPRSYDVIRGEMDMQSAMAIDPDQMSSFIETGLERAAGIIADGVLFENATV